MVGRGVVDETPVELLIARNPDPDSSLPYLLRLPIGAGLVFRTKGTWPRTSALYCHPVPEVEWPDEPDIIERVPLRACARRGAAIDVVADRGREQRSQIVFTNARGREMVFWQSPRTRKQARPDVRLPGARAAGIVELALIADGLAELQVRWPTIPIVFAENRKLAEQWTYRWLAAAHSWADGEDAAIARIGASGAPAPVPSTAEVRAWARANGLVVPDRGRLRPEIYQAWRDAAAAPRAPGEN